MIRSTARGLAARLGGGVAATLMSWLALAGAAHAQTWTTVAVEGQTVTVTGTQTMRFGHGSNWVQQSVSGSVVCSVGTFGSDPAFDTFKECDLQGSGLPPTTTVTSISANPSTSGVPVTMTASVTGASPTGTVTFMISSSSGVATATVPLTGSGNTRTATYSVTLFYNQWGFWNWAASYNGDASNAISVSNTVAQTVANPTTTALTSSVNPSGIAAATTLTATVAGASPTGTVTFKDGATTLGTGALSGGGNSPTATYSASFSSSGTHSLTAVYGGDANNPGSASSALSQTVSGGPVASSTVLTSSINPAATGQSTSLTATVTPSAATGTVTFKDGATTLGTGTLSAGVATFATGFTAGGTHNLTASYAGDANNAPSTSAALPESVTPSSPLATVLTLTATPDYVASGSSATLIASITGGGYLPSGNVVFSDGGTTLATVAMSAGQTSTSQVFSAAGLHNITASYAGDTYNQPATSNAVGVQVSSNAGGTTPGPMTWQYGYDANGNPWVAIDPNGHETDRNYDALNRPTQILAPAPGGSSSPTTIGMSYDGQDNVIGVVDPRALGTSYSVDGLGNARAQTSPDTGASNATYDAAGNLLTRTDSRGLQTSYAYDVLNRLTTISYASGTATVFQYDGGANPAPFSIGRLTKITDESGSTAYTYDFQGRVLTKTQTVGTNPAQVTSYTWGSSGSSTGLLSAMTYPSGAQVNYAYDTAGRVTALTVNPANANGVGTNTGSTISVLAGVTYNGANAVSGWTWSDGTVYQRTFDSFGRLASYPLGNPAGSGAAAGLTRTITYDNAAQILGFNHANATGAQGQFDQGFTYDNLGQLNTNTQSNASYSYSYDASGNRTVKVVGATGYANTIDPTSNRLLQAQSASGTLSFSYDNAGDMLTDGVATYTYSARGRMSSATVSGGTVSYVYNGLDQRVGKAGPAGLVPTGSATYAYDEAGQLIGEYGAGNAPIYETVYLGSTPVAVLQESGSAQSSTLATAAYNVYADHLDTPRVVTSSANDAIVWRWDTAEAFGATTPNQNPNGLGVFSFNQRFPGQVLDIETGNFYNWHRDYKSSLGRYAQSDPLGLGGGINTYAYVNGNPLMYMDPMGLYSFSEFVDDSANFSAGWGDMLSFGITARIRDGFDIGSVNKCSAFYKGGEAFGFANGLALGWAQGTKAAAKAASANNWSNFSHSLVPHSAMKGSSNPVVRWMDSVGNRLNGDYIPAGARPDLHDLMDAVAARTGGNYATWPAWRRLMNRMPYVPGSAAYGAASAGMNECGCD